MAERSPVKDTLANAKQVIAEDERKAIEALRVQAFNRVALIVIWSFSFYIGALFVFVITATFLGLEWKEAFDALLEVIKIAAVPITTLVLGYYIGHSKGG